MVQRNFLWCSVLLVLAGIVGTWAMSAEPATLRNSIGMDLTQVPAGTFQMGSPFTEAQRSTDEHLHNVTLSKPYWIGIHEVTQGEYQRVMGVNPSYFTSANFKDLQSTENFPVEQVTWQDAQEFCRKLSELPDEKDAGRIYRLPTEAEWECACRAGSKSPFHGGDSLDAGVANFHGMYPYGKGQPGIWRERTIAVASFKANAFGLHDMHGNVWEWCADKYDRDYYFNSPPKDPAGPRNPERHVARGGSWRNDAARCRSAFRGKYLPDVRVDNVGFRVVMTVEQP